MERIIYIHHNCFVVSFYDFNIIFDVFDKQFYSHSCLEKILKDKEKNSSGNIKRTYFIFSHYHIDHYSYEIVEEYKRNDNSIIIIPDYEQKITPDKNIYYAGEGKKLVFEDFCVECIRSNDEGLAYILNTKDTNIYFGGDLACWDWDDNSEEEKKIYVDYFYEVINRLKEYKFDYVFSNADFRLENISGFNDFVDSVDSDYYFPMHFSTDINLIDKEKIRTKKGVILPKKDCSPLLFVLDDTSVNNMIY
jgi:L-ascorbate metabolism protein UlaG (beta-lactamase superfamily)